MSGPAGQYPDSQGHPVHDHGRLAYIRGRLLAYRSLLSVILQKSSETPQSSATRARTLRHPYASTPERRNPPPRTPRSSVITRVRHTRPRQTPRNTPSRSPSTGPAARARGRPAGSIRPRPLRRRPNRARGARQNRWTIQDHKSHDSLYHTGNSPSRGNSPPCVHQCSA